jgi:hypothetical protein
LVKASLGQQALEKLALWVGSRAGEPLWHPWPIVLLPEFLDPSWAMPWDTVQLYHRLTWNGPLPLGPFPATLRLEWIAPRRGKTELAVTTEVRNRGRLLASGLMVGMTDTRCTPFGRSALRGPPGVGDLEWRRDVIVTDAAVSDFTAISRTFYAVTSTAAEAQRLGYPNLLVPGVLLVLLHMAWADLGSAGQIETWLRRPITAGAAMQVCQSSDDRRIWALRSVANGSVATVSRCTGGLGRLAR